jgi:hypothetical protein
VFFCITLCWLNGFEAVPKLGRGGSMWQKHLLNLLKTAVSQAVPRGGSTVVGIVVIGILGLVAGFGFTVLIEWRRGGRTMASLINALKSWPPAAGGVLGVTLCWLALFTWRIPVVIYQDHQDLVAANKELLSKNEQSVDPKSRDDEIKRLKQQVEQLKKMGSPAVGIFPVAHETHPGVPRVEYVFTTGKIRTSVVILANCDFPITDAELSPMTRSGGSVFTSSKNRLAPTRYEMSLGDTAWSPSAPLWVTIFFEGTVDRMPLCKFTVQ